MRKIKKLKIKNFCPFNFSKIESKKGISPIIATMLLIGIVVILAIIIFLWLKGFTREVVTKNLGFGEKNIELVCEDVVMTSSYDSSTTVNKVYISNNGNAPIYGVNIKRIFTDGGYDTVKVLSGEEYISIKQGKTIPLSTGTGTNTQLDILNVKRIIVIPVLLGNSDSGGTKEYTCDENYGIQVEISL